MENESINVKVSGNIIKELSEKIPSNNVALNELIKNAYDADAKNIEITIDTFNKKLTIADDGSGMNKDSIAALFHIAKSIKKYGELRSNGRYTLGSKGLGFLAVFKFGNQATWYTKTPEDSCQTFSAKRSDLEAYDNVTDHSISLFPSTKLESHGTLIEISLNDYNADSLLDHFSNPGNCFKLVNCFHDDGINILLNLNGNYYETQNIVLAKIDTEHLLFHVTYNSTEKIIKYFYQDLCFHMIYFPCEIGNIDIKLDLNIYKFKSGNKKDITPYFHTLRGSLTPLIFINKNIFNNYDLFAPNITREKRSGEMLPQIIGFIDIKTSSGEMDFNSDRTQFIQNKFTDDIANFLKEINITIQKEGSKYKNKSNNPEYFKNAAKNLKDIKPSISSQVELFDCKNQHNNGSIQNTINITNTSSQNISNNKTTNNIPESSLFLPQQFKAVKISQSKKTTNINIPSGQINLLDFVSSITDSTGKKVSKDNLSVSVDGIDNRIKILPSIDEECRKNVVFQYNDPHTGIAKLAIDINFVEYASNIITSSKKKLITIPTKNNYKINYDVTVANLIEQINKLNLKDYFEVIACSLRAIFELSIIALNRSKKFTNLNFQSAKDIQTKVQIVIEFVRNNNRMSKIANATQLSYQSLENVLIPEDFEKSVKKTNTSAHQSSAYIDEIDVKNIAKKAAFFVVIVNELIFNQDIK